MLWVQDFVVKKFLAISGVKGEENEADVGTRDIKRRVQRVLRERVDHDDDPDTGSDATRLHEQGKGMWRGVRAVGRLP